jgi:hypothetical protein
MDCKKCASSSNQIVVIRKWHEGHNKGMEFRAFIKKGKLIGLSQKDDTMSYDFLTDALKSTIYKNIQDVIKKKVTQAYHEAWQCLFQDTDFDDTFVLDLYVDIAPRHRVFVQDISPYMPATASLLFEWDELEQPIDMAEFRTLSEDSCIRRPKNYDIRFPIELNNFD